MDCHKTWLKDTKKYKKIEKLLLRAQSLQVSGFVEYSHWTPSFNENFIFRSIFRPESKMSFSTSMTHRMPQKQRLSAAEKYSLY